MAKRPNDPLKLAHFSPLPPQKSGVAAYCARLLPHLAAHMQVDVYADVSEPDITAVSDLTCQPISHFLQNPQQRLEYDLCLYHMGNHPAYHKTIYQCLRRHPGVVVLHEINLHAFFAQQANAYPREMGFADGRKGVNQAWRVRAGQQQPPATSHPLFNRIRQSSLGLIVHTNSARRTLQARPGDTPITAIPLAVELPPATSHQPPPIIIASFGYLAPSKRLPIILQALAQLRDEVPPFRYILVGQPIAEYDVNRLIQTLALEDVVTQTGFVTEAEYGRYLQQCHIGLNLRTAPTGGEMSASLMDLLAHGRATIVSNVGGFANLPDNAVYKIDQNEDEVPQLVEALRQLMNDSALRDSVGNNARQYVQSHATFPQVARQYADFLNHCLAHALQKLEGDV